MSTPEEKITKFREQLEQKFDPELAEHSPSSPLIKTDDENFGVARDNRLPPGIDFITGQGKRRRGFPYAYLQDWELTDKGAIRLVSTRAIYIITGKNLEPLYEEIIRYRVSLIAVGKRGVDQIDIRSPDSDLQDASDQDT